MDRGIMGRDLLALAIGAFLAAALVTTLLTVAPASGCAIAGGPISLPYLSSQAFGPVE